jgi:nitrite reductase/ring-hydroxylating ferredoxin subunit
MNDSELTWYETILFSELDDEEPTQVKIADQTIAICKIDKEVFAINDICTHEHAFLSDGIIEDGCVECPLHLALFDVKTGKALTAPATVDLVSYATKLEDGKVYVGI